MTLPLLPMLHVASYEHDGCVGGWKKRGKGHVNEGKKFVFAHKESAVSPAKLVISSEQ